MISIIIASGKNELLVDVSENIRQTIGVDYEIISFDNSYGIQGLCEVYNLGIAQAKYDLLCFMHEDISIETIGWGKKVIEVFGKYELGILGVAGCTYKSYAPSGWCPPQEYGRDSWRLNLKQGSKYTSNNEVYEYYNPLNESISEVVCLDGVWLCTTKKIAQKYGFDQQLLRGFHGYDIDFSLNVGRHHKLMVTYDILLFHTSEGNFNTTWLKELLKVHQKWGNLLPLGKSEFDDITNKAKEVVALKRVLKEISRNEDFSFAEIKSILYYYKKDIPLAFFLKLLVKTYFKRMRKP
ncbi:glycosyltransferase [Pedobacter frigiditerrae]|uniref:glycosyltransferase n=1 Tax=Pedobacter frigiditerrae TaxID=2530452 RepID=UPI00292D0340|nr:glycosyltransferase [Pedobacter frigiditerrae]